MEATPPPGMWAATGSVTAKAPTLADIRTGSFSEEGWRGEVQREQAERPPVGSKRTGSSNKLRAQGEKVPVVKEEEGMAREEKEETAQKGAQVARHRVKGREEMKDGSKVKGEDHSSEEHSKEEAHQVCSLRSGPRIRADDRVAI